MHTLLRTSVIAVLALGCGTAAAERVERPSDKCILTLEARPAPSIDGRPVPCPVALDSRSAPGRDA